ncbi:MAG: glutamate racemase, partial [Oscillospiraceae bacterium]|nr:glutamate racemase [Candidatus Equicaccousia limihippi]
IGVFDSGLGGLTVYKEMKRLMPGENFVYFGDTGRVPYGNRSNETIAKYALQDEEFLLSHDVKLIVAACGTVSSLCVDKTSVFDRPFFNMIAPAVNMALDLTKNGKIGVTGTAATIRNGAHKKMLQKSGCNDIFEMACPLFVPLVEEGLCDKNDPVVNGIIARYLQPIKDAGCDTVILGCTHYPVLSEAINEFFEGKVNLVNPGVALAETVKEYLEDKGELNKGGGKTEFFVSDRPDSFAKQAGILLGRQTDCDIIQIDIEKQGK